MRTRNVPDKDIFFFFFTIGNVSLTLQKFLRNFRNNGCSMKLKTVAIVTTKKKKY